MPVRDCCGLGTKSGTAIRSLSYLTVSWLGVILCACKLFGISSHNQRSVVQIHPPQPLTSFSVPIGSHWRPR
jgi:hypothetical protein